MRTMLISLLMIITVIWIYSVTIGGQTGAQEQIKQSGGRINEVISRMDP